jgi:two-component system response regulator HydG
VLTDLRMPGMDGIELLTRIKEIRPETMVILMTAYGTVKTAVKAMKLGAEDYLGKPIDVEELEVMLQRTVEKKRLLEEARLLRERLDHKYNLDNLVGESPGMLAAFKTIRQVAGASASVLLLGESGTGKELFAQALHQNSPRRAKPFVRVACAALPETLLESELFGHEKGSFTGPSTAAPAASRPPTAARSSSTRSATSRPRSRSSCCASWRSASSSAWGQQDLQGRRADRRRHPPRPAAEARGRQLPGRPLLPPQRDRGDDPAAAGARRRDVPLLAQHFLRKYAAANAKSLRFTDEALALLLQHRWPGNVRELENAIERAVVLADGDELTPFHFPTLRPVAGRSSRPPRTRRGWRSPAARSPRSSARRSCARSSRRRQHFPRGSAPGHQRAQDPVQAQGVQAGRSVVTRD